jgi:hypothetical protein
MQQSVGTQTYMARKDIWLVIAVWLVLVVLWVSRDWQNLIQSTGSTDDTMRLLAVRDLLAGKGWFAALHDARLGPPLGHDSHWSRLVDIPIALLMMISKPFLGQGGAEIFTMAAWPALLYLALIAGFIAVGKRLAEGAGFIPMLAGLMGCLQINFLFGPNAIDHHNLMMTLAVWLFACLVWIDANRFAAIAGGAIAAALFAIGFENLHIYAALNIYIVLRAFHDPARFGKPVFTFLMTQAGLIVLFWLMTVPPQLLSKSMCDAIAINSVFACVGACLSAAALVRFASHWSFTFKIGVAVATVAAIAGVALAMEPMCSKGPNAMIDPHAVEVWLKIVAEASSLFEQFADNAATAVSMIIYPVLCIFAFFWLRWKKAMTPELYALLACVALAAVVTMLQVRGSTYASLFGALFLTLAATRIELREPMGRIARIIIPGFASTALAFGLAPALLGAQQPAVNQTAVNQPAKSQPAAAAADETAKPITSPCMPRWGLPALQAEPKGYVLSDIDLGPSILLHTNHAVMMAPYHRISKSIGFGRDLIATPASEVHAKLVAEGITHLADCLSLPGFIAPLEVRADKTPVLQDVMRGAHQVDWVEALPSDPRRPEIKVWRVKR